MSGNKKVDRQTAEGVGKFLKRLFVFALMFVFVLSATPTVVLQADEIYLVGHQIELETVSRMLTDEEIEMEVERLIAEMKAELRSEYNLYARSYEIWTESGHPINTVVRVPVAGSEWVRNMSLHLQAWSYSVSGEPLFNTSFSFAFPFGSISFSLNQGRYGGTQFQAFMPNQAGMWRLELLKPMRLTPTRTYVRVNSGTPMHIRSGVTSVYTGGHMPVAVRVQ